ncbi:hypothetical protein [Mycolicibacterium nivoides]|jgi:hypothetical protein
MSNVLFTADLYRIVKQALAFAEHDKVLAYTGEAKSYHQVHLTSFGENLLSVATDGKAMGVSKAKWITELSKPCDIPSPSQFDNQPGPVFGLNVSLDDAKELIRLSRTLKSDRWTRTVAVNPAGNYAEFVFSSGETLTAMDTDVYFPRWQALFPESTEGVPRAVTGLNPKQIAKFAVVVEDSPMVLVTRDDVHGKSQKSILVTIGDAFIGVIMPVNLRDGTSEQPQWHRPNWIGAL